MKQNLLVPFAAAGLLAIVQISCGALSNTPEPRETQPVVSLETIIVETARAAQTRTATVIFGFTSTTTLTPTPPVDQTSTATRTSIPVYFSPTLVPTATSTETPLPIPTEALQSAYASEPSSASASTPDRGKEEEVAPKFTKTPKEWDCLITAKSPPKGSTIKPRTDFVVSWTVTNRGTKTWTNNGVDFVYDGGYRHEGRPLQDLPVTVYPGGSITLKVTMTSPKQEGVYDVIWTLKVGRTTFCHLKHTFEVK
ncbi:MAG: hypothetical protein FJZ87_08120 [Chloroflexi bacterium]|nr:hypothetical protein [Chloroflexota bacterium]